MLKINWLLACAVGLAACAATANAQYGRFRNNAASASYRSATAPAAGEPYGISAGAASAPATTNAGVGAAAMPLSSSNASFGAPVPLETGGPMPIGGGPVIGVVPTDGHFSPDPCPTLKERLGLGDRLRGLFSRSSSSSSSCCADAGACGTAACGPTGGCCVSKSAPRCAPMTCAPPAPAPVRHVAPLAAVPVAKQGCTGPNCGGAGCGHGKSVWERLKAWFCYQPIEGCCDRLSCGCRPYPLYAYWYEECAQGPAHKMPACCQPDLFRGRCASGHAMFGSPTGLGCCAPSGCVSGNCGGGSAVAGPALGGCR